MIIEDIYEHYRELITGYAPGDGLILKTDCFNEAKGEFKELDSVLDPERTIYVELDHAIVAEAQKNHPDRHFTAGDIRSLGFESGIFSSVLDLSTIDHIPMTDVPDAISEYHRVLMKGGVLVLVSWCSDEERNDPIDWGGPQYFHSAVGLHTIVDRMFAIKQECEFHRAGGLFLIEMVGESKDV